MHTFVSGEYTTLTTLDTASYPGYQLRSSPPRYQPEPPFSLSSPSFYATPAVTQVATSYFNSFTSLHEQAAASRPYPNSILQPGHYDIPWVHYDASPFSQVIYHVFWVCLHFFLPAFTTPNSIDGINCGVLLQNVDGLPRNPGRLQPLCSVSSCQPWVLSPPR